MIFGVRSAGHGYARRITQQGFMTTVITVPPSLDDASFEQIFEQLAPLPPDARLLVDARHARWASPYG